MYDNETNASKLPHGLTAVSILLQVGDISNVEMRKVTKAARNIRYGGKYSILKLFDLSKLKRDEYIRYQIILLWPTFRPGHTIEEIFSTETVAGNSRLRYV